MAARGRPSGAQSRQPHPPETAGVAFAVAGTAHVGELGATCRFHAAATLDRVESSSTGSSLEPGLCVANTPISTSMVSASRSRRYKASWKAAVGAGARTAGGWPAGNAGRTGSPVRHTQGHDSPHRSASATRTRWAGSRSSAVHTLIRSRSRSARITASGSGLPGNADFDPLLIVPGRQEARRIIKTQTAPHLHCLDQGTATTTLDACRASAVQASR